VAVVTILAIAGNNRRASDQPSRSSEGVVAVDGAAAAD
jgi:hypothetical protein